MIVYTTGVYDLLHRGHFAFLTKARSLGDRLIVGIQSDESVQKQKGRQPILSQVERKDQLECLPFIDEVLIYEGTDQLPYYKKVQPDIVVQADDWIRSDDRTQMINYLRENDIRLVIFPYSYGISSTEIKRRVEHSNERRDRSFILEHVKLFEIDELDIYEKFVAEKVERLVEKLKKERVFVNPITVATEENFKIVIDGVNRLEALRRVGAKFVPAHVVEYKDVELRGNVHYVQGKKLTRLSEFGEAAGEKIEFPTYTREQIVDFIKRGEMVENGVTWHKVKSSVIRLRVPVSNLVSGFDLQAFLKEKIDTNQIRYYPSNVYICDEWEDQAK